MSVSHRYQNFGSPKASSPPDADAHNETAEDQKLEAFEAGYQAGWDDATKAQADEKQKVAANLVQNLQDMSFTYQEALTKFTGSIEPIMGQIIEKLLPETMKSVLGVHIVEQLNTLLRGQLNGPLEIVVCPANVPVLQQILNASLPEPFNLVGDDQLSDGQAFIRFGDEERQVDLDTVIEEVAKAMEGFFHDAAQRGYNG